MCAICNLLEEAGSSGWEGSSLPNGGGSAVYLTTLSLDSSAQGTHVSILANALAT